MLSPDFIFSAKKIFISINLTYIFLNFFSKCPGLGPQDSKENLPHI